MSHPGDGTDPAPVSASKDGAVTIIRIQRPAARNAVDPATALALYGAMLAFDDDDSSAVAVLAGAGGFFCAGFDLKAIAGGRTDDWLDRLHFGETGEPPLGPMGPTRLRLSKPEIALLPFIGWMMKMAGDVTVHRFDRRSRGASYDALVAWLERGSSVMMFPEGTRSRTGEMLPFRSGAFRLAIETGRPVQPLAVSGTRDAIRADSLVFGRARVTLRILPQVPTADLGDEDVDDLSDRVRAIIEAARVPQTADG